MYRTHQAFIMTLNAPLSLLIRNGATLRDEYSTLTLILILRRATRTVGTMQPHVQP